MEDLTNEAFNQEKNETLLQDLQAEKSLIIGLTDQSFFYSINIQSKLTLVQVLLRKINITPNVRCN